jgi:hypothetical protein
MEIIVHRINTLKELKKIPLKYGVEIDIRTNGSKIILNHNPYKGGDSFEDYVANYKHGTLILNIKESGIEEDVLKIVKSASIKSFFFLDVEMPYIFSSLKKNNDIAIRFSEYESIETVKIFKNNFKWIFVDTITKLPINVKNISIISKFKSCLVCPERWGRKNDILKYKRFFKKIEYNPTAVMTNRKFAKLWDSY